MDSPAFPLLKFEKVDNEMYAIYNNQYIRVDNMTRELYNIIVNLPHADFATKIFGMVQEHKNGFWKIREWEFVHYIRDAIIAKIAKFKPIVEIDEKTLYIYKPGQFRIELAESYNDIRCNTFNIRFGKNTELLLNILELLDVKSNSIKYEKKNIGNIVIEGKSDIIQIITNLQQMA